ncbi:hypothetical protein NDA11_007389 [Ustilago hordei]|uniref:Zn(2)-C6 fungal-type domain-containing protein n=1 Tax=Ustilago hordei TaxID=120017 RepID=I2G3K6_USTHO|nr:uncharacterized protein UHO2_00811 [Ustilago hordei]KAJ1584811.1 hypothetical protein NDA11_007389 [Ustilago hordei]KAJ1603035.1 hypothetical protein NDA14_003026 [Ustilago hordei]CCF53749.1 uncharacterized protein UHOR_00077 [Ustilago hordei]SYW73946.1 uncharacterized protein UHO2_00811 [Ustilago hordei]
MDQYDHFSALSAPSGSYPSASNGNTNILLNHGMVSSEDLTEMPRIQKRPRRTHARRSCQMCQQRKARCELPDLDVPSGPLPLPEHQACHRCKTLQISCIVDDANKKKAKKPAADGINAKPASTKKRDSVPNAVRQQGMRKSSTNASLSSSLGEPMSIASTGSSNATSLLPSGVASADTDSDADNLKYAGGRVFADQIVYPAEARLVSRTPESSSDEGTPPPSAANNDQASAASGRAGSTETYIQTNDRCPNDTANIDIWERFSTCSRPLTLLTELVPRQNGFASKVFRLVSARATIETDITELVSNEKSKILSDWCEENLTLWLPHVSNAHQLRQDALQGKQTLSTQLLEQVLYLIAMQHIRDPKDDVVRFSVARFVIRDLARVMMTSPRSQKAVEALELLALFPVDVSVIPGPSRNRIRTDALISTAERFARSVRLDRVALTAAAPYSFFSSNNQLDDFETKRTAMEWASVKTWHNCFTMGDDELYESVDERFFCDDWSRSLMLTTEEDAAPLDLTPEAREARLSGEELAIGTEYHMFAERRWSRRRRIGSTGLAMRCLAMKQLLVAFDAIRNSPIDVSESERIANVSKIFDEYTRQISAVDQEFRGHLVDGPDGCQVLSTWLTLETTAGYLLVLGAGILRSLGIDKKESLPSHELALLIQDENASAVMRTFLTRYGEQRILAAEKVLVNVSLLCSEARSGRVAPSGDWTRDMLQATHSPTPNKKRWMVEGQSRTVLPMMNVCGYALEAAFNAMEMHATMFKLWKTPPKRSESWQAVFSNVIKAMLSLDPKGSIQNGSIPATCAYVLQGMLKVIVTWTDCSRKKESQRTTANTPGRGAGEGGGVGGRANGFSSSPDVARYEALLQDYAQQQPQGLANGGFSVTASLFEANLPHQAQGYSDLRSKFCPNPTSNMRSQPYQPDTTESLAAAIPPPHFTNLAQQQSYSFPQLPPSAMDTSSYRSNPSNSSSHSHSPPHTADYTSANGMQGAAVNGNGEGTMARGMNTNANGEQMPAVAINSLDFILNDVLGSSEWSGILRDIWRTDI